MVYTKYNDGWIEVITGPMFSGKTAESIKRIENLIFAKKDFLVFKSAVDDRWEKEYLISRTGRKIKSQIIKDSYEIQQHVSDTTKAILIDEVQFFDNNIINVIQGLANSGIRVIVAGLDLDFRMKPFKTMSHILSIAEFVTKLSAVCFKCGRAASFSKKIEGDKVKRIEIGDNNYEARCRKCF